MSEIYKQLRQAIGTSSKTRYRLWRETGVDQGQLARFMIGDAGLSVENVERLLEALGLQMTISPRKDTKGRKRGE